MTTQAQGVYNLLMAVVAIALLAFVVVLVASRQTVYKVLGILLLILVLFWLGNAKGEQAITSGLDWAVSTFGNWAKKGSAA